MDFLDPPIKKEYDRWAAQLDEVDPYKGVNTIGIHDVLRAYFLVADYFIKRMRALEESSPKI
jgi:hypothetical protein